MLAVAGRNSGVDRCSCRCGLASVNCLAGATLVVAIATSCVALVSLALGVGGTGAGRSFFSTASASAYDLRPSSKFSSSLPASAARHWPTKVGLHGRCVALAWEPSPCRLESSAAASLGQCPPPLLPRLLSTSVSLRHMMHLSFTYVKCQPRSEPTIVGTWRAQAGVPTVECLSGHGFQATCESAANPLRIRVRFGGQTSHRTRT